MSLGRIVAEWEKFRSENKKTSINAIALIGYNGAGKSLQCELLKAKLSDEKDPNLVFEDAKVKSYVLPGVISPNPLKVGTTSPQLYKIKVKESKDQLSLVDVPAYCTIPFQESMKKMWSATDAKITFLYLTMSVSKCSYMLVIDEKHTRNQMDGFKNMITGFIEMFEKHPQELLDSTIILFTKCPTNLKKDQCTKRLENVIKAILKGNHPQSEALKALEKSIIDRNALLMELKFSSQQNTQKQIRELYDDIKKVKRYKNDVKNLIPISAYEEEIKKYLEGVEILIRKLIGFLYSLSNKEFDSYAQFLNKKAKTVEELYGNKDKQPQILKQKGELPTIFSLLDLIKTVHEKHAEENLGVKFVNEFLNSLTELGLLKDEDGLKSFADERLNFFDTFKNQISWKVNQIIEAIGGIVDIRQNQKLQQALAEEFDSTINDIEYHKKVQKAIEFVCPTEQSLIQSEALSAIWVDTTLNILGQEKPAQALENCLKVIPFLEKSGKVEKTSNIMDTVAEILVKQRYMSLALTFFGNSGNPYKALKVFRPIIKNCKKTDKIQDLIAYAQFLRDLGMYDTSREIIFLIGSVFQDETDRVRLSNFLIDMETGPKKMKEAYLNSFMKKQVKSISQNDVQQIERIIGELKQKEQ